MREVNNVFRKYALVGDESNPKMTTHKFKELLSRYDITMPNLCVDYCVKSDMDILDPAAKDIVD